MTIPITVPCFQGTDNPNPLLGGGQFPQFGSPLLVTPQPSGATNAIMNPIPPPPATWLPIRAWLYRLLHAVNGAGEEEVARGPTEATLASRSAGLAHLNQLASNYTTEAEQMAAVVRAISGVTELLHSDAISRAYRAPGPTSTNLANNPYNNVHNAAEQLRTRLDAALHNVAPLSQTHAHYHRALLNAADHVIDILHDASIIQQLTAYANDNTVPVSARQQHLELVRRAIARAAEEVARTPRQATIAQEARAALYTPSSQGPILSLAASLASLPLGSVGSLPGPDAASAVFIKIVGTWRLPQVANNPGDARGVMARLQSWVIRAANMRPEQQHQFEQAMERVSTNTAPHFDSDAELSSARSALTENFQTGLGLTAALQALNVIQLLAAISAVGDPAQSDDTLLARVSGAVAAGAATTAGAIQVAQRALQSYVASVPNNIVTIAGRQIPARTVRDLMAFMDRAVTISGTVVSTVTIVASVIQGIFTIGTADEGDTWTIVIGSLQIASGVALAAGIFMGVPGGQPIGVLLGLVAGAMSLRDVILDAIQTGSKRVVGKLIKMLKDQRSDWDSHNMLANMGLQSLVDALESAHDGTSYSEYDVGLSDTAYHRVYHRLRNLGVPREHARQFIHTTLLDAAVDRLIGSE
ncbi:MAG: hypothetical protein U0271_05355 [Polyangiaceae bacterium]